MVPSPVPERHPDDSWTLAVPKKVGRHTERTLRTLADAILPAEPRTETTIDDVVEHALVSLQYMPGSSSRIFLLGMLALNWSPLWRLRGLHPLSQLGRDDVRKHLRAVAQSRWLPVRLLMYGPLGLFMSTYFDQDYVHRAIDYDPVPFVEERIELRRRWVEGVEPSSDDEIRHLPVVIK